MRPGSKRAKPAERAWERYRSPREMRLADLTVDDDGKPLIGTPLGRRQVVLDGVFAREEYRMGKLIGWHDRDKRQPIIEFPDGTREAVFAMSETNWKSL